MRRDDWQLGTWGRIPVSMHWTVLLSAAWLYIIFQDVASTLIGCVAMLFLMLVHEYGHVLALRRRKLGVTSIQLFGVHGETTYNEYAAKGNDAIVVAWAGVAAQAVVMVVTLVAAPFLPLDGMPYPVLLVWGTLSFMFEDPVVDNGYFIRNRSGIRQRLLGIGIATRQDVPIGY